MYVFDTGIFIDLFRYYYPNRFPSLWINIDNLVNDGLLISTLANLQEIKAQVDKLNQWACDNEKIFQKTTKEEAEFVKRIYDFPHFQQNIPMQQLYKGGNTADPFIIAKAATIDGYVVTTEILKPNAAKIPNICDHFSIPCLDFEQFMEKEGWSF